MYTMSNTQFPSDAREARKRKGLTLYQAAMRIPASIEALSQWELAKRKTPATVATIMAREYDAPELLQSFCAHTCDVWGALSIKNDRSAVTEAAISQSGIHQQYNKIPAKCQATIMKGGA